MTAEKQKPKSSITSKEKLWPFIQQGHLEEAEQLSLSLIEAEPNDFYAWFTAGFCAARQGQLSAGIDRLENAFSLARAAGSPIDTTDSYQSGLLLGQLYLASRKIKLAADVITGAIREFGLRPEFCNDTGNLLAQCNRYEDAALCYRQAIDSNQNHAQAHNNLGNVLVMMSKPGEAIGHFRSALELNGGAADTQSNLAAAYDAAGDFGNAREMHLQALTNEPSNAKLNLNFAMHLLRAGDIESAVPHYLYRFQSASWGRELDAIKQVKPPAPKDRFDVDTVLVGEQGIGDEIYLLKRLTSFERPRRWSYIGDGRLESLFTRSFPEARFIARSAENVKDLIEQAENVWRLDHLLLQSVRKPSQHQSSPLLLNEHHKQQWKDQLDAMDDQLKLGISWTGGLRNMDRIRRQINPQQWSALADCPYTLIDIQYDDRPDERGLIEEALGKPVHRLARFDLVGNLDTSAALLGALDFIITADNSTAHLAGAADVEAHVL